MDLFDHFRGTEAFEVRQELNLRARVVESMTLRLIQGVDRVVAGFGVDVGLELLDFIQYGSLIGLYGSGVGE